MLPEREIRQAAAEWSTMTLQQREDVKSKVAALRLKAQSAEPLHVGILETWRTKSESICDEADTWGLPEEFAEGARWAIECASLERLFSPEVLAWEALQRHIETGMLDLAIGASPRVLEILEDVLTAIDWNADGSDAPSWQFLISDESLKAARSSIARDAARSKNSAPRQWVREKWRSRVDMAQSKAAFGREYMHLVRKKFGVTVTPETITRDWLKDQS